MCEVAAARDLRRSCRRLAPSSPLLPLPLLLLLDVLQSRLQRRWHALVARFVRGAAHGALRRAPAAGHGRAPGGAGSALSEPAALQTHRRLR